MQCQYSRSTSVLQAPLSTSPPPGSVQPPALRSPGASCGDGNPCTTSAGRRGRKGPRRPAAGAWGSRDRIPGGPGACTDGNGSRRAQIPGPELQPTAAGPNFYALIPCSHVGIVDSPPFIDGDSQVALKECRECGKEVSASAPTCPHCGVKRPGSATIAGLNSCAVLCLIVGGVLTLLITVPAVCGVLGG